MKIFDAQYLDNLTGKAKVNLRLRQHLNVHQSYQDASQRLFNAIQPGSYIRPHRHASDPRDDLLIAIRGVMAMVTFDDQGAVTKVLRFGTDRHGHEMAVGVEVSPSTWHTAIALGPCCVLLEVKAGPFNPDKTKNLVPWAPEEGCDDATAYLGRLHERVCE